MVDIDRILGTMNRKKKWRLSLSAPLVKGDRVGAGLKGLQGVWYDKLYKCVSRAVIYVRMWGQGSLKPCSVNFFLRRFVVCKHD